MKKIYSLFFLAGLALISFSFAAEDNDDGRAGHTGSPGEQTCAKSGCHAGSAVNGPNGSVSISAPDLVNGQYVPGQQYTINVTVSNPGRDLFGLGFEALQSSGANAGILSPGVGTHILNATVQGNSRASITHLQNGGASQDQHTFTFTWTAPSTNIGNVTFYVAGNAANGNGSTSGDLIYTASQVVPPSTTSSVEDIMNTVNVNAYPNPVVDVLRVDFSIQKAGQLQVVMFDAMGRKVKEWINESIRQGEYSRVFDMTEFSKGQYIMHWSVDGEVYTTEFIQK